MEERPQSAKLEREREGNSFLGTEATAHDNGYACLEDRRFS